MFKLLIISLALIGLNEASLSHLQFVVPDDSYALVNNGKLSVSSNRGSSSVTLSNALSDEDLSAGDDRVDSEEANEAVVQTPTPTTATSSASSTGPAGVNRSVRPLSSLGAFTSAGLARPSVFVSSSTSAQASASSSGYSPSASARSSATIQHRVLPAESLPLPITISQRPGLRTVIAPETLTYQQPALARVGEVVQQIPTAVSHQRQTVVHKHARVVTPVVAPAVRTVTSQVLRAYHTPLVYSPQVTHH
ncbi:retinin [Haematobia irritans]|uniref:retinin n=1 Tax=Haematobia irritans TaxID=7368 RepID=UPI003F503310